MAGLAACTCGAACALAAWLWDATRPLRRPDVQRRCSRNGIAPVERSWRDVVQERPATLEELRRGGPVVLP